MLESVTCYWTNDTARDLFERYERHLAQINEMMAMPTEIRGPETLGTAAEIDAKAAALCVMITRQMTELVHNFAMPAVALPKAVMK